MSARVSAFASLRHQIDGIEMASATHAHDRVALGHSHVDQVLGGGLARGAIHEVFCAGRQCAAATGFVAGLARRVASEKPLLWLRQDFSEIESGTLSMSGLAEFGIDPARMVVAQVADIELALALCADALACEATGAVVLELRGDSRHFDLVASRKLTLAAQGSGVTGLLLRIAARPVPSSAETRWMLHAAHSPPAAWNASWGVPRFDAELLRNRRGAVGRWTMEWNCDECVFCAPSAHPQPVAATSAHRPHPSPARHQAG